MHCVWGEAGPAGGAGTGTERFGSARMGRGRSRLRDTPGSQFFPSGGNASDAVASGPVMSSSSPGASSRTRLELSIPR